MQVDRHASVFAAGEIARLSYDAHAVDRPARACRNSLRLRAYRSDPDGGLLGPLNATHFARRRRRQACRSRLVGGVERPRRRRSPTGRLFNPVAFDRTRFEGDLPSGWDAELYRNGELLAFSRSDGSQRYVFDDVPLIYGDNRFEIILYGPQGQQRSRLETINVGQEPGAAGQDLVLGRRQPAGQRPAQRFRRPRRRRRPLDDEPAISASPTCRRRSRSSMASTSAPRSALLGDACCLPTMRN